MKDWSIEAVRLTDAEKAADAWASEAVEQRITRMRAAATEWQKAVASITGLFGAGTLLNADDAVRKLTFPYQQGYGALAAVSLVAAAVSLWLASSATSAEPIGLTVDVKDRQAKQQSAFDRVNRLLFQSRAATAVAVGLLILSFAVRWYGPVSK